MSKVSCTITATVWCVWLKTYYVINYVIEMHLEMTAIYAAIQVRV